MREVLEKSIEPIHFTKYSALGLFIKGKGIHPPKTEGVDCVAVFDFSYGDVQHNSDGASLEVPLLLEEPKSYLVRNQLTHTVPLNLL